MLLAVTSVRVPHSEKRGLTRKEFLTKPDAHLNLWRSYLGEKKTACSSTTIMLKITFPTNTKFKSEATAVTTNKTVANIINKAFKANQLC